MSFSQMPLAQQAEELQRTHRWLISCLEWQIAHSDEYALKTPDNATSAELFRYRAKLVEMLRQMDRFRLGEVGK